MTKVLNEYNIKTYKDQFTQVTRAVRRNLLIVSSLVILLTIKGISINPTFGLDFSSNLAKGAIAIVVIYELITFFIYAIIDYRIWIAEKNTTLLKFKEKTIDKYLLKLEPIGHPIPHLPVFLDPENPDKEDFEVAFHEQLDQFKIVTDNAKNTTKKYNDELKSLFNSIKKTNYLQFFRIYIVDWLLPIFIAIFALSRSKEYIVSFLKALYV
jgi:hypothetical protein